jgi:hypothetical protein
MGRRHKQRLESRLGCTVMEPVPVGVAQPEYSGQPKGWYGESKMKVGLCLGLWVRCMGLWVIGFTGNKIGKKKSYGENGEENQALIP